MEATFQNFTSLVRTADWKELPDFVNEGTALQPVTTDEVEAAVHFPERTAVAWGRSWGYSRSVYVGNVTFPDSHEFRGVGIYKWGARNLVILKKEKGHDGSVKVVRFTTLEKPEQRHDVKVPEGLTFVDAFLGEKGPLQVLLKGEDGTQHHQVWLAGDQVESWTKTGRAQPFVGALKNIPVLLRKGALAPDNTFVRVCAVAAALLVVSFVWYRLR